jgi:hypothetical protein
MVVMMGGGQEAKTPTMLIGNREYVWGNEERVLACVTMHVQ